MDLVTTHYRGLKYEEIINGTRIFRIKSLRKRQETCETLEMASFILSAIPFILKLTKKNKYNLIHCHFAIPTGIIAYIVKKLSGLDYIITTHGSDIPGYNPERFQLEHKFTKPLLKSIMKKAKAVIAPSEYLKGLIEKNVCPGTVITVIPNGIKPNMFSVDKQKNNWILMSGRLLERKGFQYALKALKDISLPAWEVHIAGDGPHRNELERLAKEIKNKVVFHGWLHRGHAELKNLYECSKVFILPSEAENASIALLEAMNAELAIVTANTTGCCETVGNTALLVNPRDTNGIKDAILQLTQNNSLIKELGQKARKRSIENYSWDDIIDEYTKICNESL